MYKIQLETNEKVLLVTMYGIISKVEGETCFFDF